VGRRCYELRETENFGAVEELLCRIVRLVSDAQVEITDNEKLLISEGNLFEEGCDDAGGL
jgi:hypothetical protein